MATDGILKQWVSTQDGLGSLTLEEVHIPKPGDDEVLVKINAVSLNFRDTEGDHSCYPFEIRAL